ncbi:hypothetical protein [Polyangium jinanense]|uniref:Uncharacterized protein n=1 Tax=Polyangium jinanense TaxID=2829994 RepID=A0A9X4AQU5_9BACT|nr:hypothetical protein [Polyangium jinanense]MDC3981454.1 hypothetical protein [Polyangium jinanense]
MPALTLALLAETPAHAEESHYRVELSAKQLPACDRLQEFEGLLDLVLARPLLDPPASRVLSARIVRTTTGGYGVDLVFTDPDGHVLDTVHREYPAAMCCHEVLYKAALAAALWMENREAPPEEPPAPAKAPEPCPSPSPPPPADPPPPAPPEPPAPAVPIERLWFLGAGGLFAVGIAPEVVGGVQLGGGFRLAERWTLEAHARATFPLLTRPLGETQVRAQTVSTTLGPCYQRGVFGLCGVVLGGATWMETTNRTYPMPSRRAFLGLAARGLLEHPIGDRLKVRVDAEIASILYRPRVKEADDPIRWHTAPVTANFGASLLYWF